MAQARWTERHLLPLMLSLGASVAGLDNGVGLTPAMGYNTWDDFRCDGISAANVEKVADAILRSGLDKLGYVYVGIDDCWAVSRNQSTGVIVEDPRAFPNGMKAVADYVHLRGLKFGIYTDRGSATCEGRPGSQGFERIDAETYAAWGVDFVKEDSCNAPSDHATALEQYGLMRDALNATGRPIYFALCGWSDWYAPEGKNLGNSWRFGYDVNSWSDAWHRSLEPSTRLADFSGPGGWNDPDALMGSSQGAAVRLTPVQSRTQFSLWSMMAAPLMIGSNIHNLSAFDLETYSNKEVISVDQDRLGMQGKVIWHNCASSSNALPEEPRAPVLLWPACQQMWLRQLSDGYALAFVNYTLVEGSPPAAGGVDSLKAAPVADDVELSFDVSASLGWKAAMVRDLWLHEDVGVRSKVAVRLSGGGDSKMFKLTKAVSAVVV